MSIVDMLSPTWVYAHFWTTRSEVVEALRGHRVVRIAHVDVQVSRDGDSVRMERDTVSQAHVCPAGTEEPSDKAGGPRPDSKGLGADLSWLQAWDVWWESTSRPVSGGGGREPDFR